MKHVRVASLLRQRQPHLHIACCPLYVACRTVTHLLRGARCPLHAASLLRRGQSHRVAVRELLPTDELR